MADGRATHQWILFMTQMDTVTLNRNCKKKPFLTSLFGNP